jgi:two-component sensor histidine kinase
VIIHNLQEANNLALPDFYAQHSIVSTVDVVIAAVDGQSYGVLEIDSPTLHYYDEHDINFLTGFANVLAEAVSSAKKNHAIQALLERQKLLAAELQHRVSNNLHVVMGMLNNYALSTLDDTSREGISSISRHVLTLANIYDSLLGSGLATIIDLGIYLRKLCAALPDLQNDQPGRTVDLVCQAESVMLPLDSVTILGLAVAELVTNSYRHAFPGGEGTIFVTLISADAGSAILMIQDDGVGFDTTAATSRTGISLVRQLLEQIGGTAQVRSEVGTLWTLIFPVSEATDDLKAAA